MRSRTRFLALLFVFLTCVPTLALAQETQVSSTGPVAPLAVAPDEFLRGVIVSVSPRQIDGLAGTVSDAVVRLRSGEEIEVALGGAFADPASGLGAGDQVVVVKQVVEGEATYYVADRYRLPWIWGLVAALILAAVIVGGKRGVTATFGLAASVAILALVMLPQFALGVSPVLVAFLGAIAIATVTTFIAHGVRRESGLILGSILAALVIGAIGAFLATWLLQLNGLGSEEAIAITYGPLAGIDLGGLLIAGVILGCLGVLDDVAATQVAAVKELATADKRLTRRQLYRRGMRIGSEHVAALINTLFLAYAGASLPLLIVGKVNLQLPVWAFLNTEAVAEEILRTAVGSGALILAVPIATALAAWHFGARRGAPLPDRE